MSREKAQSMQEGEKKLFAGILYINDETTGAFVISDEIQMIKMR